MHSVHTTPGLIIGSRPRGEAGKNLYIFTRGLGLINAVAQGIRTEASKLRYHTQDYSLGIFSLVRGRESWRLTGAQPLPGREKADLILSARLSLILKRFLQGEEPHPELFDLVESSLSFQFGTDGQVDRITADKPLDRSIDTDALEYLSVFRILHSLGYISGGKELAGLLAGEIDGEILVTASSKKKTIIEHINKALRESQL